MMMAEVHMSFIAIVIGIIVVGAVLWVINKFIPMDTKIKQILNIVVVVALVLWLLRAFGVWHYLAHMKF
jgi:hypothetical protein